MIFIFFYIILTAISFVSVHLLGIKLPDLLMMSLTTAYAIFFFNIINYKTVLTVYQKLIQRKFLFFMVQISVVIMWAGSFYIPIYYSPALFIFTFMSLVSGYGSYFSAIKSKQLIEFAKLGSILTILIIFYIIQFQQYSLTDFLIMLVTTFATGSACYVYINYSNQIREIYKFSATEILAVRYWLFFIMTFCFMLFKKDYLPINLNVLLETFVLSFILLIIPIFFLQKSIEKIGGHLTAIFMGITPFATFLLEKIVLKTKNDSVGYLSLALVFAIILPDLFTYLKRRWLHRINKP